MSETTKKYDYVRVPVTPGEREIIEAYIKSGVGRNAGAVLHNMAFDWTFSREALRSVQEISERIADLHSKAVNRLKTDTRDRDMYESDLIKITEHILEIEKQVGVLSDTLIDAMTGGE